MEEVIKIVGIGFMALIIAVILKQYRPEYAIYVSIIAGVLILFLAMDKITGIINLLKSISDKTYINKQFLGILLKITGIAIIAEFAVSICSDAGENRNWKQSYYNCNVYANYFKFIRIDNSNIAIMKGLI